MPYLLDHTQEELQQRDMRSDVEALLDLDNVNWDFNNPNANSFRARAVRYMHISTGCVHALHP